jgi:hypothetical protein
MIQRSADSGPPRKSKRHRNEPTTGDLLPSSYDETIVMLVPVDPAVAHVYWDVSPADLERSGSAQTVLRFYDIDGEAFDGTNARGFFDMDIELESRSSYVSVRGTQRSFQVDLGFIDEHGEFVTLARSNTVQRPRSAPSTRKQERYMRVTDDYEETQESLSQPGPETSATESAGEPTAQPIGPGTTKAEEADLTEWSERSFESGLSSS